MPGVKITKAAAVRTIAFFFFFCNFYFHSKLFTVN